MASSPFPSPTKTYHQTSYSAISPTQPALSTAGKSIVITGGGTGIGQAAALSFAKSGTSNLLLLGRRTAPLEETRTLITTSYPKTAVHIASADLTDRDSLDTAFTNFTKATGTPVDILFANAGFDGQRGPLSSMNVEDFAQNLTMNAVGNLNLVQAYLPHAPTAPKDGGKYRARIIHTSSAVVHAQVPTLGAYSTAKLAAAWMFDIVAKENPDIFVMNYHPGIIATSMDARGQEAGLSLEPKDDISLAADFPVWAASSASDFVGSGRFLWAHWDVDELKEIFAKIEKGENDDGLKLMGGVIEVNKKFTVGLVGWP